MSELYVSGSKSIDKMKVWSRKITLKTKFSWTSLKSVQLPKFSTTELLDGRYLEKNTHTHTQKKPGWVYSFSVQEYCEIHKFMNYLVSPTLCWDKNEWLENFLGPLATLSRLMGWAGLWLPLPGLIAIGSFPKTNNTLWLPS